MDKTTCSQRLQNDNIIIINVSVPSIILSIVLITHIESFNPPDNTSEVTTLIISILVVGIEGHR